MKEYKHLLGVLGGMGPSATVYFLDRIVNHTDAEGDQDHIPVLVFDYPQVPDRTLAYLGKGESPLEALNSGIRILENAGADMIAIPCNSAHLWFHKMQSEARADILNMIELAAAEFKKGDTVGILGTTLTVQSKLYENILRSNGVDVVLPDNQSHVMDQIRLVKAGNIAKAHDELVKQAGYLIEKGATHILAGCTEVPVAINQPDVEIPFIDPMEIMAKECVKRMGARVK